MRQPRPDHDRLRRPAGPSDQPGDPRGDRRGSDRDSPAYVRPRATTWGWRCRRVRLTIEGSVGYYVAGLNDGATVVVRGGAGWGAAESMRDGTIVIDGNAGNAVAASIRSGTVVVRGDASTRAGIAMKGGMLIVAGSVGPMAGFMMQKGILVVCGDAADGSPTACMPGPFSWADGTASWGLTPSSRMSRRPSENISQPFSTSGRWPRRPRGFAKWWREGDSGTFSGVTETCGNQPCEHVRPTPPEKVVEAT